jgi:uncharacterized phage-associated protein
MIPQNARLFIQATSYNKAKYAETILALLQELGGTISGKKKLAKLLYFTDFGYYEKAESSITGERYLAQRMGPLGANLSGVIAKLKRDGLIDIADVQVSEDRFPTQVFRLNGTPNEFKALSAEELEMIRAVAKKYGNLNGKELEVLSHEEAPYAATEAGQEIHYELAIYRGSELG